MILESFSNVGTKPEASHYLKRMRLEDDDSLIAHNTKYAAVHEAAYGLTPERQMNQTAFIEYANTLSEVVSDRLVKRIVRNNSYLETLRQTMDEAEKMYKQARQEEVNRKERNALRETTIAEEAVNEVSFSEEVNFMSPGRNGSHFNSTMKNNGGNWNNSPRGRNNSYNSYNSGRNNSYFNNRNGNQRNKLLQQLRFQKKAEEVHTPPRQPKSSIEFEYNAADRNMFSNLRRTVDSLKKEPQSYRSSYKKFFPRVTNKSQEEVREDSIATIKIDQIQSILGEDLDLVFNALVIGDYIDEEANA